MATSKQHAPFFLILLILLLLLLLFFFGYACAGDGITSQALLQNLGGGLALK